MRILATSTLAILLSLCVTGCDEPVEEEVQLRGLDPMCEDTCLPMIQNCDAGESCQWTGEDWACADAGSSYIGDACAGADECSAGLLCVEGERVAGCESAKCCTSLCDAEEPAYACTGAGQCIDVFAADEDTAGLCLLPLLPDIEAPACGGLQEVPQEQSKS